MSRTRHTARTCRPEFMACHPQSPASRQKLAEKNRDSNTGAFNGLCRHPQHKFGRMYLCGWSKRWGATVCANRFVAIKFPTEDEAKLARDHAATRWPNFTAGRPLDR